MSIVEQTVDQRSLTSADNGKLGGRPKSEATIRTQLARAYIAQEVAANLDKIVTKAVEQAVLGDTSARTWLSEQSWGKPIQRNTLEDDEGNQITILIPTQLAQAFNINAKPNNETSGSLTE